MSIRNLDHLFRPESIAVIGASGKPQTVGATLMRNLLNGGYSRPIMPVNPRYESVAGVMTYPDVASLPIKPDLALICTPAATVPDLIAQLGERGTRAAIVVTAGLGSVPDGAAKSLQQQMIEAARPYLLRILGPNCVGLLVPGLGINASFAHTAACPGKIAFVTQSGGMVTAVLDWAKSRDIGFSHFISLGNSADVDFGDVLDYLASEPRTRSILLYIESITEARKFMSAARAAARNKPVIVVKAGRAPEGARAAASHTGALAGADDVYDAAIRRAGMLRVDEIEDLFFAVETLARARPLRGERLVIMTNGGGPGVMATDSLGRRGGRLASLSPETMRRLDAVLPATWSHGNPVDIIGDAPVERYVETLKILLDGPDADAVLFIHAPSAIVPSERIAEGCAPVLEAARKNALACWLGADAVERARGIFIEAGIPTYDTPEDAVGAFMQMVDYRRNQDLLMETPPSLAMGHTPDTGTARQVVEAALAQGRTILTEPEAKALLAAYDIPVVETRIAKSAQQAAAVSEAIGFPVAVKVLSRDISHKSDVGGVVLDLDTPQAVEQAVEAIERRVRELKTSARLDGFSVQRMARRPGAHELIVGVTTDPVFGPVILFGQGGIAVEIIGDKAVALPPLNAHLARELVSRTRVSKLLAGYRNIPAADRDAIYGALIKVSQLVADIAEIHELDINPLLADEDGVIALDARVRVEAGELPGPARLAIRPYPRELEESITFQDRPLTLRPIRPDDDQAHHELFSKLEPEDIRFRFFRTVRELPRSDYARYTQIDYDREMAFIATREETQGRFETLGVVRAIADPDNATAEFAIVVRSDLKGLGLGSILMDKIIRYSRDRGTGELCGEVLDENRGMQALARKLGFVIAPGSENGTRSLSLKLS